MGKGRRNKRTGRPEAKAEAKSPPRVSSRPADETLTTPAISVNAAWIALALVGVAIAAYLPVVHNDFVYYDDPKYVTENAVVLRGLTLPGIRWAFTTGTDANWFPLTWMTHMLDVQLYGAHAGGHHVTNLMLHVISTLLLFGVLYRMTGAMGRSGFVAGLFALHPLHVESVAWVAERKDVLSTLFWMLTLWAYVWYVRKPQLKRMLLVLLMFALGLMSKPMLVTLPFVLLLLDAWPLNRLSERSIRQLIVEKLPMFALAIASSIVTFIVQRKGGAVGGLEAYPLVLRIGNALVSYVGYIGRMFWPARLAAFYPYPESLSTGAALGAAVILAAITFLAIRNARSRPYLIVGWLWYLGTLVPVIGLIQVGNQAMADRYTYVPLIGLFIIIAWGAYDLLAKWTLRRIVLPITGALVLASCAIIAHAQVQHWKSSSALWTHALDVTDDNYVANNNLGLALAGQGKIDEAIEHYNEALRLRPNYATARTNLGAALAKQGKSADAISNYTQVLKTKPELPEAHVDLGAALVAQGKVDDAIAQYNEALRLKPDYAEAHANLGLALASQGKVDEAISHYRQALRLKPGFVEVYNNLGYVLATRGQWDDAIKQYNEAIRLKPDFELARMNLAVALANQGKTKESLSAFMEVLRINPNNDAARASIAQLAEQARREAEKKSR